MVAVVAAMFTPRSIAFTLPVTVLGSVIFGYFRARLTAGELPRVFWRAVPASVFVILAVASALWSADPIASLSVGASAAFWLILCCLGVGCVLQETRSNSFHMAEGLWVGLLAGLVFLLFEILSHQTIKIFFYNALQVPKSWLRPDNLFTWSDGKIVAISGSDLTRSIAPISLLLWPSIMCLKFTAPYHAPRFWSWLVYILSASIIMLSDHETSKVAIVVGTVIFLLARWNRVWSGRILQIGWVGACLAVVPVVLALYQLDLHNKPWVQPTMQHRIVIWNHAAEQSMQSPILGVGAGMMSEMYPVIPRVEEGGKFSFNARHAHNIYLQTWLELGVVGAALLTLLGLGVIERIQKMGGEFAPHAHAAFASAMTIAAASYGMWQAWFMAMFALTIVCFAVAIRVNAREPV